jgi:rhamnosyltransferase
VSYYPDELFEARLERLNDQFAAVFWVDNTPGAAVANEHRGKQWAHYLSRNINTGLASALNMGCEAALGAGFEWVVTFDQDSDVAADFLLQQIGFWGKSDSPTFMLGCNYADGSNLESPRFTEGDHVTACPTVITSGCLMCLPVWDELGRFRDDYFIDGVDHEICLRGRSRDLVVARHGRVLMKHRIGERSANYRIFPYLHAPVRKYYSMRNGIRNIAQYATNEPAWAARKCATLAWELVIALLFEPDRRRKSSAMFRGIRDGVKGKMGIAPDELSR